MNLLKRRPLLHGLLTTYATSYLHPEPFRKQLAPAVQRQSSIGLGWYYFNQPPALSHSDATRV